MAIDIVTPNDPEYAGVDAFITSSVQQFDYEEFSEAYNKVETLGILAFIYKGLSVSNLVAVLKSRGIVNGEDYTYKATKRGARKGEMKVAVKKLTDTECRVNN